MLAVTRPVDTVIEFLEAEQARGVTHVLLDEAARDGLRALYRRAQGKPTTTPGTPNTKPGTTPAVQARPQMPPPAPPEPAKPVAIPTHVTIEGSTKSERLASLRQQTERWVPATSLGSLRETMVFGIGNPDARIMLVGEAPGYEEERQREPFVGPAGQKLTDILKAMGISREDVYLTNIVKFRPATPRQTTNNRKPSPEEIAASLPLIRAEIEIIRPACIIALGATAAEGLLQLTGNLLTMRGSWHECQGIPTCVTYHPSYLLQSSANLSMKRQLWDDMLSVMERLQIPISEKQRGFFLPKR